MKILIVGAGPTGLTAAVELARRGIVPEVIDRKEEASTLSRAVGVLPRSLRTLTPSGVSERLLAEGVKMRNVHLYFDEKHTLKLSLRNGHPDQDFGLALAQDRTEAALRDAFIHFGGKVGYGTELAGLRQEHDKVLATTATGTEQTYDIVIGADGIRSVVREAVGIEFPGHDLPGNWSIADVDAENWRHPADFTACNLEGGRVAVVAPLAPTRFRVISNTDDALKTLPLNLDVKRVRRQGQFNISIRLVQTYRRGRVFLAGDAAHCHSPAGGRGMNLGIADAAELADRIVTDRLDGYSASRYADGKATIAASERARRLITSRSLARRLLSTGAGLLNRFPPLHRPFARDFLQS